jgi:enamine deaminase RidA (YjgF/YER057c/UK114 family)
VTSFQHRACRSRWPCAAAGCFSCPVRWPRTRPPADQILRNIGATLAAIGKDLDDVIRVGVYLTDMSQFGAMNEAYRRHFADPYPARTAIGVAALPLGAAVEMDVVVR